MRALQAVLATSAVLVFACSRPSGQQGTVRDLETRPVAAADDPVNQQSDSSVDALVLTVTIDSATVRLDTVVLARMPRSAFQRGPSTGDRVTAVGFAGATRVSEGSAADGVLNAQEGAGIVRVMRRQVVISVPAPQALDAVQVDAAATGASARVNVRSAYTPYCPQYRPDNKYCPPRG